MYIIHLEEFYGFFFRIFFSCPVADVTKKLPVNRVKAALFFFFTSIQNQYILCDDPNREPINDSKCDTAPSRLIYLSPPWCIALKPLWQHSGE